MKKRLWITLLLIALLIPVFTVAASADSGPKPSVVIHFKGLDKERYFVTLLSEQDSTGPWSTNREYGVPGENEDIWEKFCAFSDADGFHFLGYFSDCTESNVFRWGYYPPGTFKILLYFPDYDRFVVSADRYTRYAFDSYYTADASGLDIHSVTTAGAEMPVRQTYDFTWELFSLLARIVVTIAIELGLAWLFGFRTKRQILIICLTNLATQTILNVLLNAINYNQGALAFIFHYVWMEFVVFFIEGSVYQRLLRRYPGPSGQPMHPWLYAFAANLLSFAGGMLIARWMPGIF